MSQHSHSNTSSAARLPGSFVIALHALQEKTRLIGKGGSRRPRQEDLARAQGVIALYPHQVKTILNILVEEDDPGLTVMSIDANRLAIAIDRRLESAGLRGQIKQSYLDQFETLPT